MGDKNYDLYEIASSVSNAIKWIHNERIYHFDIKAENILCSVTDTKIHFILSDFGASKSLLDETDDKFYGLCGTKGHIMPESLKLMGQYVSWGPRMDAFAFAVVILECFTVNTWFNDNWMKHGIDPDILSVTIANIIGDDGPGIDSIPVKPICHNVEFAKHLFRKLLEGYNRISFYDICDFIHDYTDIKMLEYDKSAIMPSPATQIRYMNLNRRMANSIAINEDRTICMRQQYHLRIFAQRIMALSQRGEITPGVAEALESLETLCPSIFGEPSSLRFGKFDGYKILIIDDDKLACNLYLCGLLHFTKDISFDVHVSTTFANCEHVKADMVICDWSSAHAQFSERKIMHLNKESSRTFILEKEWEFVSDKSDNISDIFLHKYIERFPTARCCLLTGMTLENEVSFPVFQKPINIQKVFEELMRM